MNYIYLGKIVNTHGIKGEVRIISDFSLKKQVFVPNFKLYIGKTYEEVIINSYRHHKNFEMITLKGIDNINDVLKYKGANVYLNKDDLNVSYLIEDLVNYKIVEDKKEYGYVYEIRKNNNNYLLYIKDEDKYYYIPYVTDFIKNVDIDKKEIEVNKVGELR